MSQNTIKQSRDLESLEKKISPKDYNMMIRHLDLQDVYLKETKSTLHSRELLKKARLDFDEKPSVVSYKDGEAKIEVDYALKAKCGKKKIFTISAKYIVVFQLDKEPPDGFFELYNRLSLPVQTFPYFREFANSIVSRMGLPPLILGLRKYLVS